MKKYGIIRKISVFLVIICMTTVSMLFSQNVSAAQASFTNVEDAKSALDAKLINAGTEQVALEWSSIIGSLINIPNLNLNYIITHYFCFLYASDSNPPFNTSADANENNYIYDWNITGDPDSQSYPLLEIVNNNKDTFNQIVAENPSKNHLWLSMSPANWDGYWFPVWLDLGSYNDLEDIIKTPQKYPVKVIINKDGQPADISDNVELRQNGESKAIPEKTDKGIYEADVSEGTYEVFVNNYNTGKTIAPNTGGDTAEVTINYYTVEFNIDDAGKASGSTVAAMSGGKAFTNGEAALEGAKVKITATGKGAGSYTYLWSGKNIEKQTTAALTLTITSKTTVKCVVTGIDTIPATGDSRDNRIYILGAIVSVSVIIANFKRKKHKENAVF